MVTVIESNRRFHILHVIITLWAATVFCSLYPLPPGLVFATIFLFRYVRVLGNLYSCYFLYKPVVPKAASVPKAEDIRPENVAILLQTVGDDLGDDFKGCVHAIACERPNRIIICTKEGNAQDLRRVAQDIESPVRIDCLSVKEVNRRAQFIHSLEDLLPYESRHSPSTSSSSSSSSSRKPERSNSVLQDDTLKVVVMCDDHVYPQRGFLNLAVAPFNVDDRTWAVNVSKSVQRVSPLEYSDWKKCHEWKTTLSFGEWRLWKQARQQTVILTEALQNESSALAMWHKWKNTLTKEFFLIKEWKEWQMETDVKAKEPASTESSVVLRFKYWMYWFRTDYLNYKACQYLDRHNFECAGTYGIDRGHFVVSGRFLLMRKDLWKDENIRRGYLNEHWSLSKDILVADDDAWIGRMCHKLGREVAFQWMEEDTMLQTRLGVDDWQKFNGQMLRWAKTWFRTGWTALWEDEVWRRKPWTAYAVHLTGLVNFAFVLDVFLFWSLSETLRSGSTLLPWLPTSLAWSLLLVFWFFTKILEPNFQSLRSSDRGRQKWKDPWYILYIILDIPFGWYHSILKLRALFSVYDFTWTGRQALEFQKAAKNMGQKQKDN
ncbi:hypothetical protein F5Y18DRAFT_430630 [Xylariaceae sp. FL1019]|nr:hypothetical protein F5Y18DRAFT_430630 [Xylariaceae sp. FL1019]